VYHRAGDPTTVIPSLPLRQHNRWAAEGLVFVTLSDMQSLQDAAVALVAAGVDPREYAGQGPDGGPWSLSTYLADVRPSL
jgi:hypothetical protein